MRTRQWININRFTANLFPSCHDAEILLGDGILTEFRLLKNPFQKRETHYCM